jgi:hypothetical protein
MLFSLKRQACGYSPEHITHRQIGEAYQDKHMIYMDCRPAAIENKSFSVCLDVCIGGWYWALESDQSRIPQFYPFGWSRYSERYSRSILCSPCGRQNLAGPKSSSFARHHQVFGNRVPFPLAPPSLDPQRTAAAVLVTTVARPVDRLLVCSPPLPSSSSPAKTVMAATTAAIRSRPSRWLANPCALSSLWHSAEINGPPPPPSWTRHDSTSSSVVRRRSIATFRHFDMRGARGRAAGRTGGRTWPCGRCLWRWQALAGECRGGAERGRGEVDDAHHVCAAALGL